MAYRWKDFPDEDEATVAMANRPYRSYPHAVAMQGYVPNNAGYNSLGNQAQYAAQQMQGYNPMNLANNETDQPSYQGIGNPRGPEQYNNMGQGVRDEAYVEKQQIMSQIESLESQLKKIDEQIAAIDRSMPNMSDADWEIAAKRAAVGDYAAYDNMMNRSLNGADSYKTKYENAVNGLKNAEKLTWGLQSKDEDNQLIAKNQIGAALREWDEYAAKNGITKKPEIYNRLQEAMNNNEDAMTARSFGNELALKIYRKTATDADLEKGAAWAAQHPNSTEAKEILAAVEANKGKTKEAKAKRAKAKADAKALYDSIANLPLNKQFDVFEGWTDKQRELFQQHYKMDAKTGAGVK